MNRWRTLPFALGLASLVSIAVPSTAFAQHGGGGGGHGGGGGGHGGGGGGFHGGDGFREGGGHPVGGFQGGGQGSDRRAGSPGVARSLTTGRARCYS